MEKTKIIVLATAIAVLSALVLVNVAFAQTTGPTQTPTTGVPTAPNGGAYCYNEYGYCPGLNGYANDAPQSGYGYEYGGCGSGGMMGGYYR